MLTLSTYVARSVLALAPWWRPDIAWNEDTRMNETNELVRRSEPRPGVVQLTLARPDKLNALTAPLVAALHDHLRAIAADLTCRVVVLTGAGRGFCAGLGLSGFGTMTGTEWSPRSRNRTSSAAG